MWWLNRNDPTSISSPTTTWISPVGNCVQWYLISTEMINIIPVIRVSYAFYYCYWLCILNDSNCVYKCRRFSYFLLLRYWTFLLFFLSLWKRASFVSILSTFNLYYWISSVGTLLDSIFRILRNFIYFLQFFNFYHVTT